MSLSPKARTLRARNAAHISWANTDDPSKRTKPARDAFMQRFLDEADERYGPDLSDAERRRRADHLMKAHMADLSRKRSKARASKAGRE